MRRTTEKMDMHTARFAMLKIGKEEIEIGDTQVRGLSIRVRKTTATWCLRGRLGGKQSIWTIGPIGSSGISVTAAREYALEAKKKLKNGEDPKAYLQEMATGGPVVRTFDPAKDGMTWEKGVDAFLEWVKRYRRRATYDDYRKTLRAKDCTDAFQGKLLKSITDDHVRALRDNIDKRAPTQAEHTLRILKSCLGHLADTSESGIKINPASSVRHRPRGASDDKEDQLGRVPTIEETGTIAWNLAAAKDPSVKLAGTLLLFTAQRIRTIISARPIDFEPIPGHGGLWNIPRPFMKVARGRARREHIIPLPPTAWFVVEQAKASMPEDSKWLFPQLRLRRAGDEGDGHISRKPIADALGPDIAPHDVRRALGTYAEKFLGWPKANTKMILDHMQGLAGDVTAQSYSLHDGTHITWNLMKQWEGWILAQIARQAPPGKGPVPFFLTLPASRQL